MSEVGKTESKLNDRKETDSLGRRGGLEEERDGWGLIEPISVRRNGVSE